MNDHNNQIKIIKIIFELQCFDVEGQTPQVKATHSQLYVLNYLVRDALLFLNGLEVYFMDKLCFWDESRPFLKTLFIHYLKTFFVLFFKEALKMVKKIVLRRFVKKSSNLCMKVA